MGEDSGVGRAAGRPHAAAQRAPSAKNRPSDEEFEPFFKRMLPDLIKYGFVLCRNHAVAEDAALATLTEIWMRWFEIINRDAYARKVLCRKIGERRKEQQRTICMPPAELPESVDEGGFAEVEEQPWVDELVDSLPPRQQVAFRGRLNDMSFKEILAEEQRKAELQRNEGFPDDPPEPNDAQKGEAAMRKNLQLARKTLKRLLSRSEPTCPPIPSGGRGETK